MSEKTPHTDLEKAALQWWLARRPVRYTPQDHLENPEVNTSGDEERALARAVAVLVRSEVYGPFFARVQGMQELIIELQENQKRRIRILNKASKLKKGCPAWVELKKECAELSARAEVIQKELGAHV